MIYRTIDTTYTMQGDDTVRAAATLVWQLPAGLKLLSLEFADGWWTAVVRGRREPQDVIPRTGDDVEEMFGE